MQSISVSFKCDQINQFVKMITDEIVPILEGLDEYNMTEVGFLTTA